MTRTGWIAVAALIGVAVALVAWRESTNDDNESSAPSIADAQRTGEVRRDLDANSGTTSWYRLIDTISVRGTTANIDTLIADDGDADDFGDAVCRGVAATTARPDNAVLNIDTIRVYATNGALIASCDG